MQKRLSTENLVMSFVPLGFRYIFRKPYRRYNLARFTSEIGMSVVRQVPVYVKSGHASRLKIFHYLLLEILYKTW